MTHPVCAAPARRLRAPRLMQVLTCLLWCGMAFACGRAQADTLLNPALLPHIRAATFEVVAAKPKDTLTYEKPLPLELLPFQDRNDKYYSVGTAFAIGPNRFVTAAHVFMVGFRSLWGTPELRDAEGRVYAIDQVEKFALRRDFVVFSLKRPPAIVPLAIDAQPAVNQAVYSVGNALGTGIVIRNGLYTSDTPEDQDGQWQWIRFSAAASPGNSGGPLLNAQGAVMGVVTIKSPNENLNYALPMREVQTAPAHRARFNRRGVYQFDVFDATLTSAFNDEFQLPLSVDKFFARYARAVDAWDASQLAALLQHEAKNLFPDGTGAQRWLYRDPSANEFPQLLVRDQNGVWSASGRPRDRVNLSANGYIDYGASGASLLFHLRRPDDISNQRLHHDPALVMDLLLKTGLLTRSIGPERIRVTSLGAPANTGAFVDRWGRRWQTWSWPVPYANGYVQAFALPTPDGYAIMLRLASATANYEHLLDLRALIDFVTASYTGTLAQWRDYLADPKLLPKTFALIHIDFDYGKSFRFNSQRFDLAFTPELQAIAPDSMLTLGFDFLPAANGAVSWDVGKIWLAADNHDTYWLSLTRSVAPPADLDDSYQNHRKKLLERRHPFDRQAFNAGDKTRIQGVAPAPTGQGAPAVLYSAYVDLPGNQEQTPMRNKLELLLQGTHIKER